MQFFRPLLNFVFMMSLAGLANAQMRSYTVDMSASIFSFEVEHFGVMTVKGLFTRGGGTIRFNRLDPRSLYASVFLDVGSVDTKNSRRDRELRSEDFLDAPRYPIISFESSAMVFPNGNGFDQQVSGRITIYGTTREVTYPVTISLDKSGREITIRSVFSVQRGDFGLDFGFLMNAMIADEVNVVVKLVARADG